MKTSAPQTQSRNAGLALAFLALAAAVFLYYRDIFLVKGAWLVGDHAEQHFPWQWVLADSLKRGIYPFWTDFIHAGFPLVAEGQIGLFYLPNFIFASLFSIERGYAWNICAHLLLSVFFTAAYLRSLKLSPQSIFAGTFVYAFGSTLGGAYYNITCLKTMTWFPLALMLSDCLLEGSRKRFLIALGLGFLFTLQMNAGYLQFAVYAILFTGIYMLCRFLTGEKRDWFLFIQSAFFLGLGAVVAAVLSFPQLALTQELAFLSNRAQTSEAFAYVGSFSPFAVICALFPNFEGFFTGKLYLGVLPFYFIIAAFCFDAERRTRNAAALVAGIAFLLALGQFSPLYVGIVKGLHFYSFRTPFKFIFFSGFFLSVLCAIGVQALLEPGIDNKKLSKSIRAYFSFLFIAVAGVLGSYFIFRFFEPQLASIGEVLLKKWFYGKPGHPFDWPHYQEKLSGIIHWGQWVLSPKSSTVYLPFLKIAASVGFLSLLLRYKRLTAKLFTAAIFLFIADLQFSYSDIQGDYASYESFYQKDSVADFLSKNQGADLFFNYSENPSNAPLPQAKGMVFGLRSANAYSPLILKDYYDAMGGFGGVNDSIAQMPVSDSFLTDHLPLLGFLGVRYVVTDRSVKHPDLLERINSGRWRVLENMKMDGRYFLVSRYETHSDRSTLLKALHQTNFDLSKTVLLEKPLDFPSSETAGIGTLSSVQHQDGKLIFETDSDQPALLVLGQVFYPGWSALVDNQPVDVLRANYAFQAVAVPAGKHRVELSYNPWHRFKRK